MGAPFPVMQSYLGFVSDMPRHELPPGVCWDLVNFLPQQDGAIRKRYGFASLGTQDFATIHGGATATGAFVGYCPFSTVAHEVLALNGQGYAFSFQEPGLTGSYLTQLPTQYKSRPVWHHDQMVLTAGGQQAYFYTGRVGGFVVGVGTPQAKYATLWGDYTVMANDGASNLTRIWFSAPGNPRSYDLTNSWIDVPGVVKGIEGIRGAILVWTDHALWRITGTTPPSQGVIGDLDLKHLFDIGLVDERSIDTYGGWIIWANAEGVWMTDGASAPKSLTVQGGINNYWRSIMKGYTLSSTDYIVAGGVFKGYYMVGVTSINDGVKVMLACDLGSGRWFRLDAPYLPAMTSHAVSGHEDLYWVSSLNNRVLSMASAWDKPSHLEYDGVSSIAASIETPMFRGFQRYHRRWIPSNAPSTWHRLYLSYEAQQNGVLGNALRLGYTTDFEAGAAYTTLGYLPYQAAPGRSRISVNPNGGAITARAIGFRIDQVSGVAYSNDLRINDLELEYSTREGSR